ncbi:MAG: hypothetical protein KJ792_06190 [Actinobacteria bacterium]|nr:hypothetical protein [Actinomycetota bacterium]
MSDMSSAQAPVACATSSPWAPADALGNLALGVVICCLLPVLWGTADPGSIVAAIPWVMTAFPLLLLVVVVQLKAGDLLGATANGILGVVLLCQNFVQGLLVLAQVMSGHDLTAEVTAGAAPMNGFAYLASGILLLVVGVLVGRTTAWGACAMWAAGIGFTSLAAGSFGGASVFGTIGALGITIVGVWFFYSGVAMLVAGVVGRLVLPIGRPWGRTRTAAGGPAVTTRASVSAGPA